jgi:hypothetical protein
LIDPVDSASETDKMIADGSPTSCALNLGTTPMPTFRVRVFLAILAFSAFTLVYVSVGIRWHIYRARASLYARQEVEHTFEAANFARAARTSGGSEEDQAQAAEFRKLAEMHVKAARECTQLRELYEKHW